MIYWDIVKFSFFRFFSYPWEIITQVVKRMVELMFLIYFWSIVIQVSDFNLSLRDLTAYFLITSGIGEITMARWGAFSSLIGNLIKMGQISNYLVKPTNVVLTLYAVSQGRNGMRAVIALIGIVCGLIISPPHSIISIFLFSIFFINAIISGFAYNLIEGTLYLHMTEASGIRNSMQHFIRIFSGSMAPLFIFPPLFQTIVTKLPFAYMVYWPTLALSIDTLDDKVMMNIGISICWSIVLVVISFRWWNSSLKAYEAVGI